MNSICIATYNGERFIEEQLSSILEQINFDDEIIISDDMSTDSTINIIKSFKDHRIKLYQHTKKKKRFLIDYSTCNFEFAIKKATGKYIFLSDQDDIWLPNKYNRMLKELKENDKKITITDCKIVDTNKNIINQSYFNLLRTGPGFWKNFYKNTHLGCCIAFNRNILNYILPFPKSGVAHDFWIAVFGGLYFNTSYINETYLLYRKHENNVTTSGNKSGNSLFYKIHYRIYILLESAFRILTNLYKFHRLPRIF